MGVANKNSSLPHSPAISFSKVGSTDIMEQPSTELNGAGQSPTRSSIQAVPRHLLKHKLIKAYRMLIKPAVTEFIFTFFLLLIGIMVGAGLDLNAAALSTGFTLYAFIVTTFDVSGGHLNPIISYGIFLCGGIALDMAIVYIVVQLAAGVAAAGIVKVLVNDTELPEDWALIKFNEKMQNESQAVMTEALISCALLLIAYMTIVETDGKNPFGPMLVGIFVAASIYAVGPLSGAGINPARCFGPVVVFGGWETVWIYFVGPFLGTTVAGIIYRYFLSNRRVPCLKFSALRNIWTNREDGAVDVVVDMETTV